MLAGRPPTADEISAALAAIAQNGVPADGSARVTDVGTEGFLRYFDREVLTDLIASGGSTCRFFEATYGSGKTHQLDLLASLAVHRGMAVVRTDLSQAVNLSDWKLVTEHILKNITLVLDGQSVRSLPAILQMLRHVRGIESDRLRCVRLPHPGFLTCMRLVLEDTFASDAARERAHRYLMGERIGVGELQRYSVRGVTKPLSQRNSEQVLSTISNALVELGLPGVMLLFDENERTLAMRGNRVSKKVQVSANLIRRLIDACVMGELKGVLAVFAVLPGFLDRCSRAYPALGQRLQVLRTGLPSAAWRWPVLDITALSDCADEEDFAEKAVARLVELVACCGKNVSPDLRQTMHEEAQRVLEEHAGAGYRRPLMKILADLALEEIEA
ncbi:hypothetical protein NKDENANG_00780 [Candidatus Entotheonellaceae bacterium PAL068K]